MRCEWLLFTFPLLVEPSASESDGETLAELEGLVMRSGCISAQRPRFTFATEVDADSESARAFKTGRVSALHDFEALAEPLLLRRNVSRAAQQMAERADSFVAVVLGNALVVEDPWDLRGTDVVSAVRATLRDCAAGAARRRLVLAGAAGTWLQGAVAEHSAFQRRPFLPEGLSVGASVELERQRLWLWCGTDSSLADQRVTNDHVDPFWNVNVVLHGSKVFSFTVDTHVRRIAAEAGTTLVVPRNVPHYVLSSPGCSLSVSTWFTLKAP